MIFFVILIIFLFIGIWFYFQSTKESSFQWLNGRHVFITGGSKGIGLELAKICLRNGSNVTIIARNKEVLERIKLDLIKLSDPHKQNVLAYSVDVAESTTYNLENAISEAQRHSGPIDLLICCAGTAIARTFEDTSLEDFHHLMNLNYFGTVNAIKACLSSLKANKNGAKIMLFSSMAGVFGLYGYSAYSASKFAIIGLAEVLDMELLPHKINVTVAFPPDTDTPGYKVEQIGKPKITQLISEEGGLYTPEQVAKKCLKDCLNNQFISAIGLNGIVLTTMCSGMMPTRSWPKRLFQVLFMGLFRALGLHFLHSCENIVNDNTNVRTLVKKSE